MAPTSLFTKKGHLNLLLTQDKPTKINTMGLDMCIYKRTHFTGYDKSEITGSVNIKLHDIDLNFDISRLDYIQEEVVYWRKAWDIHRWIIANCNEGKDTQDEIDIDLEKLQELLQKCKTAKDMPDLANDYIPANGGDLINDERYGGWYFFKIDETIEQLTDLLNKHKLDDEYSYEFIYQALW